MISDSGLLFWATLYKKTIILVNLPAYSYPKDWRSWSRAYGAAVASLEQWNSQYAYVYFLVQALMFLSRTYVYA